MFRPPDALEPGDRLGPYRLVREIATGGMGAVFLAEGGPDRPGKVVVKALLPGHARDEERRLRFDREIRALRKVSHPNLLAILDADACSPIPYLVVEHVEGPHLGEYLLERNPPLKEKVRIVSEVAFAVAAMHEVGVVHRDIKPPNVVLRPDGDPVLIDFGLARIEGDGMELTRRDRAVGTPRYMAPEQLDPRAGRIGPRTDVYQLGALLYSLATGGPPLHDSSTREVYRRVQTGKIQRIRRLCPGFPPDLERAVTKAMAWSAARRFASAIEFGEELARFVRGEPLLTTPGFLERIADRLSSPLRRRSRALE